MTETEAGVQKFKSAKSVFIEIENRENIKVLKKIRYD